VVEAIKSHPVRIHVHNENRSKEWNVLLEIVLWVFITFFFFLIW
jgi:hypothetical protein